MPWRLVARQRASYFQNRVVKSKILGQLWVFLIEKRNNHENENDPGLQIAHCSEIEQLRPPLLQTFWFCTFQSPK